MSVVGVKRMFPIARSNVDRKNRMRTLKSSEIMMIMPDSALGNGHVQQQQRSAFLHRRRITATIELERAVQASAIYTFKRKTIKILQQLKHLY